ncbi:hypothetical protein ABZV81_26030 [Streptomyces parvus]|uniref:hypothetical protein n=1 Tax=Streptomyces TaxID=1883 RepID=UPI000C277F9D|nr:MULTISPECIES: hypothetical protein [unclassified Streptomyces]PJN28536.1 hypothetical protein CG717_24595 [Streptomyces sp. CB02613]
MSGSGEDSGRQTRSTEAPLTFAPDAAAGPVVRMVQEAAAGAVLVTHADCSQARFCRNPDGTLAGPSGSTTDLVADSSGRLLRQRTGTTLRFDSTGLLRLGQRQPSGQVLA